MTWKNSNYSSADMVSMQQDAVRRVREMQRIANNRLNPQSAAVLQGGQLPPSREKSAAPPAPHEKDTISSVPLPPKTPATEAGESLGGIFSKLGLEQDRLIILVLLIVLMQEGTDQKLLLALCYLLL